MVVLFQGSSQSGVIVVIDAVAWEYETQMRHAKELAVSTAVCGNLCEGQRKNQLLPLGCVAYLHTEA